MVKHRLATGLMAWVMLHVLKAKGFTSPWNVIYYRYAVPTEVDPLCKHEMTHVKQMKDLGKIRFLVMYIYYNMTVGYWNNPFEIEARNNEYN